VPKRFFSDKNRQPHLGPYPLERLARSQSLPDLSRCPAFSPLSFDVPDAPDSIINAMREHQSMLDAIRIGFINPGEAACPPEPAARAEHLKAFGYFLDAAMVGICSIPDSARLAKPFRNPGIDQLADDLYEFPRDPTPDEPGTDWILDSQAHRAALLASETAAVLANYLRLLGFDARAHTATTTDLDLNQLAVSAGLATVEDGLLDNPYLGRRFGIGALSTTFALATDKPLAPAAEQPPTGDSSTASNRSRRSSVSTPRRPTSTKPTSHACPNARTCLPARPLATLASTYRTMPRADTTPVLLQDGEANADKATLSPEQAADLVKATGYYLGADAMGISRCPDWSWYSHDATGAVLEPPHDQAISMIIDQGYNTMEGSSGDDWIAVSQSMRAYLRFSLVGGVLAKQIRNLGYSAKAHTVMDGEVLQPPLLLLSGLGEVSRIGEVILNPFLGPRLKSGAVTTDLPLAHDKPIDFGLQRFCESCNKCARECPSGAITAGPKTMFNGYEIWKSDSQKCTTYRITTPGGAMCGRCMKTCPWNLEGLFTEKPFRWAAMNIPAAAPLLAKLDDAVGNGGLNEVKKWWWDLEIDKHGVYRETQNPVNRRGLQTDLKLKYEDQTLAVYPANLAPHPHPYPFPMDREKGIEAYQAMVTAEEYKARLARGDTDGLLHVYTADGESPVVRVEITKACCAKTRVAAARPCCTASSPKGARSSCPSPSTTSRSPNPRRRPTSWGEASA